MSSLAAEARQDAFSSSDSGVSWTVRTIPTSSGGFDPTVDFDTLGDAFYCYLHYLSSVRVSRRLTGDTAWGSPALVPSGQDPDKPYMVVDKVSQAYRNRIYVSWSDYRQQPGDSIGFSYSTNQGASFHPRKSINGSVSPGQNLNVNLAVAPNGVVYAAWSIYDNRFDNSDPNKTETALGFNRIFNGGDSVGTAFRMPVTVSGVHNRLPNKPRLSGYPVMAVDTAGGGWGTLYLIWTDKQNGDADIFLIKSTNGGQIWTDPVRVNQDQPAGNGRDQWLPWMTVTPEGHLYVGFYDCRNDTGNFKTEMWVARSTDGGNTFEDFRVGDVGFSPCLISAGEKYGPGDYTGITASSDYVYACWADNRVRPQGWSRGVYQAHIGVIPITGTSGTIASSTEWNLTTLLTGSVTINPGVTVTVKPGTKVLADTAGPPVSINVMGNLVIEGSGACPIFLSKAETPGGWYGIHVMSGGSVDWGDGCTIMDATVGVTVDDGADMTEIRGVRVENTSTCGFYLVNLSDSIRLVNDTVVDVTSGKGIYIVDCNPVIDSSEISACSYGVHAVGSSAQLRHVTIEGSGSCGVYNSAGGEFPDTLRLTECDVTGYFSGAHVYAAASGHCRIDDCELISDTGETRSPYGIFAGDGARVRVRHTKIHEYGITGVYSDNSQANLGALPDTGYNSIWTSACSGPCDSSRVIHYPELEEWGMFGGEGMDGGGGPPPPEPVALPAEGNWWGDDSPDSVWFVSTDYTSWLGSDPLGKRTAMLVEELAVPKSLAIRQYPNPFNAAATIEFSLPTARHVQIKVFNILGQVVRDLVDRDHPAGQHTVTWDGTDARGGRLASGLYLYLIAAGDMVETKKMVLLK